MEKFILAIRVVTAIALTAIAVKLWSIPEPVTRKEFLELKTMRESGVAPEKIIERRKELIMSIPYVYVQDGSITVNGAVAIE